MTDKKRIDKGYVPQKGGNGHQPQKPETQPTGDPKPQGGYVPAHGDNPTNDPAPPGDE